MRIAIVSPSDKSYISKFLPNENMHELPNGYEGAIFIGSLIDVFLKMNHEVIAITTSPSMNNDYEIKKFTHGNFTWIVVPRRPHSFRFNGQKIGRIIDLYSYEIKKISFLIKSIKPDIVHAHWSYEFAGAAIKSGIPHLVTVHDNAHKVLKYIRAPYRLGKLIMSEIFLRKARNVSTVSPYMITYVSKRCSTLSLIPNPVPILYSFKEVSLMVNERLNSLESPKIIMINNGWNTLKNGSVALIAFKELKNKMPKSQLHLFGVGCEKNGIAEEEANTIKVQGITYHGSVSNSELLKELKSAHLLLHTSLEESFGVVLIEAMSLGIPAIGGVNSGAVPWVIGIDQLLVDVRKPDDILIKIQELITSNKNYEEISLKCYGNTVKRFSSENVCNQYIIEYNRIINEYKKTNN
jgi:glycosyltransferase involved in cell wall biosynthesis